MFYTSTASAANDKYHVWLEVAQVLARIMQAGWKISLRPHHHPPTTNLPENLAPVFAVAWTGIFTNCSWDFNKERFERVTGKIISEPNLIEIFPRTLLILIQFQILHKFDL